MTEQTIVEIIKAAVLIVGGGIGVQVINWLRFRNKDKADTARSLQESLSNNFTVGSDFIEKMIRLGTQANDTISNLHDRLGSEKMSKADIQIQLVEAQHAVQLCRESLERCKKTHGCQ